MQRQSEPSEMPTKPAVECECASGVVAGAGRDDPCGSESRLLLGLCAQVMYAGDGMSCVPGELVQEEYDVCLGQPRGKKAGVNGRRKLGQAAE